MSTHLIVPTLGEAISEAVLAAWLSKPGESVRRGDGIAELETDKATLTLESPANGVLLTILVPEGATITPGQVLALIGQPGEEVEAPRASDPGQSGEAKPATTLKETPAPKRDVRISPAARRMARQMGIDLERLIPSKPGARITTEDVENFTQVKTEDGGPPFHRIELNRTQKAVAERMLESAQQIPQFSVSMDAEVDRLLAFKRELAAKGIRASVTALLVHLVARLLEQHPLLNARLDGDAVLAYETVNMGVAVAGPAGLVVPVIHSAEQLSLPETAEQLRELARSARENRLSLSQVSEGTFTLSNLGMYGVQQFVPLVNPPQSTILGVGAARQVAQPTPDWGIRTVWLLTLTVSADHRVLDGAAAAQFLASLKTEIEKADNYLIKE